MPIGNVPLPVGQWELIAESGLDAVSWQVKGQGPVFIAATTSSSAPTGAYDEWPSYQMGEGEIGQDISALFAGIPGVTHLWAYSPLKKNEIWRSHA